MNRITIEIEAALRHVEALRNLYPDVFADEEFAADMIEGETGVFELLSKLADRTAEAEDFAKAIKARCDELAVRQARFEKAAEVHRELMFRLMTEANLNKAALPNATLSIRAGTPSVVVHDEAGIPARYTRTKVEIDKAAIKVALKSGEDVPGAYLSNGAPSLAVRRG